MKDMSKYIYGKRAKTVEADKGPVKLHHSILHKSEGLWLCSFLNTILFKLLELEFDIDCTLKKKKVIRTKKGAEPSGRH